VQERRQGKSANSPGKPFAAGLRLSQKALILFGVFAVGLVAAAIVYKPLGTPAIGYDSAASVLYFDRIAAHQPLEGWVASTSKPLCTLIDGLAFNLTRDWRSLAVIATAEYAVMLAVVAALAWRISGPVAAGLAAAGLLGSSLLFNDGSLTYATPWAILFWALAGLALTGRSPRYGLAGVALFLGALMRFETLFIVGLAMVALGAWRLAPAEWLGDIPRPPRRAALLLVGLAALPVMLLHDWLLTGNAFFWLDVSAIVSKAVPAAVESPARLAQTLGNHFAGNWARLLMLGLAAVGAFDLFRRRQMVILVGLAACGPGVVAFLEFLAFRNTYVSGRYTIPADAALVFAAAVGAQALAAIAIAAARGAAGTRSRFGLAAVVGWVLVGVTIAVVIVRPYGPIAQHTRATVNESIALQVDAALALPTIRTEIAGDRPAWVLTDVERPNQGPPPRIWVPSLLVPRSAVDLSLPVWSVGSGSPIAGNPSGLTVTTNTIVFIDRDHGGDVPQDDAPFEIDQAVTVGHTTITPLLSLPERGIWVVMLSPAAS
jgi:hypothetical protein